MASLVVVEALDFDFPAVALVDFVADQLVVAWFAGLGFCPLLPEGDSDSCCQDAVEAHGVVIAAVDHLFAFVVLVDLLVDSFVLVVSFFFFFFL